MYQISAYTMKKYKKAMFEISAQTGMINLNYLIYQILYEIFKKHVLKIIF